MIQEWVRAFKRKRLIQKWEAGIEPFLSTYIGMAALTRNPEQAFRESIPWTPYPLRVEWESILSQMERGDTLESGIGRFAQGAGSPILTRISGALIHLSREGVSSPSINSLQKVIEDVRAQERNVIRAFSQKLTMLTLVFIACSALIPAFFLSFVAIGSTFLESSWGASDVLVITLFVFPLIDMGVLAWVWIQTPPLVSQKTMVEKKESFLERLERMARANGIKDGWSGLLRSSVIEGCALFLIGWSAYLSLEHPSIEWEVLLIFASIFPLIANTMWMEKKYEQVTKQLERQVLDSLLYWSALPSTWGFERAMREIAENAPSPIRGEWNTLLGRIQKGEDVKDALPHLGEGRESLTISRASHVLIQGYVNGPGFREECARMAAEGLARQSLYEERESTLLIEKFTLLGAGGMVVPLLLGLSTGMVERFAVELGNQSLNPELQQAAVLGARGYLFIYSILASGFVGVMEGNSKPINHYMMWLIPLSQFIWWAASFVGKG